MNTSNHDWLNHTPFSDDVWLSMLVDGELSVSQRRKYVEHIKQTADWRKVATAFLDEQVLESHVCMPDEAKAVVASPTPPQPPSARRWISYLAMVACLAIGTLLGPWLQTKQSSVEVVDLPVPTVEKNVASIEVTDAEAEVKNVQSTLATSLPGLYQVSETRDEAVYYADFSLPQFMLDALVFAGHRVTFDQEFMGYTETSDNPAAVPINVIRIQKYGRLLAAVE